MYQSMVVSLLYVATATRSDFSQAVGAVSEFSSKPSEAHLTAVKRILLYLKGSLDITLKYKKSEAGQLIAYSDADYAGGLDDRDSTSGSLFLMSCEPISWLSKKQPIATLPTTEAEYVALSTATQEAMWLRKRLSDFIVHQDHYYCQKLCGKCKGQTHRHPLPVHKRGCWSPVVPNSGYSCQHSNKATAKGKIWDTGESAAYTTWWFKWEHWKG